MIEDGGLRQIGASSLASVGCGVPLSPPSPKHPHQAQADLIGSFLAHASCLINLGTILDPPDHPQLMTNQWLKFFCAMVPWVLNSLLLLQRHPIQLHGTLPAACLWRPFAASPR